MMSSYLYVCLISLFLFFECTQAPQRTAAFSASSEELNGETEVLDINRDGFMDTVRSGYYGGSSFGVRYCTIVNGKTADQYISDQAACFCEFRTHLDIPPALLLSKNASFKEKFEAVLLPPKADAPDPSLQWILEGLQQTRSLEDLNYFDKLIHRGISWQDEPIQLPETYYLELHEIKPPADYYLLYSGSNHYLNVQGDSLIKEFENDSVRLWKTMHGLILQKQDRYAWIFTTDVELTGAPAKLRWRSVNFIRIVEELLILDNRTSKSEDSEHYNMFVIDLRTGKCARLKPEIAQDNVFFAPKWGEEQIARHSSFRKMREEFKRI